MPIVRIIGAGIGGLTAAIALRRAGFEVTIQERMPEFAATGAGIVLAPNAVHLLTQLGVDLKSVGQPVTKGCVRDFKGRAIQQSDLSHLPAPFDGALTFDRAELHQVLLACLPAETIHLGQPYDGRPRSRDEILIGADGIYSAVRRQVAGEIPIQYSGCTCWRAICPNPGVDEIFEAWGGATRIGVVPLTQNRLYVFLVKTAPAASPRTHNLAEIRKHFDKFSDPVPAVLDSIGNTPLLHHDLEELLQPFWGVGKTILIGDAAHAMTPNLGQGAGMAIEDAVTLPKVLAATDSAGELRKLRHDRVCRIQIASRRLGKLAHWQQPLACLLRDTVLRAVPKKITERSYKQMIEGGLL